MCTIKLVLVNESYVIMGERVIMYIDLISQLLQQKYRGGERGGDLRFGEVH